MNSESMMLTFFRMVVKELLLYEYGQMFLYSLAKMLARVFINDDFPAPTIPKNIIFINAIFLSLNF